MDESCAPDHGQTIKVSIDNHVNMSDVKSSWHEALPVNTGSGFYD